MSDDIPNSGGEQFPRTRVNPENLLDPFLGLLERFIATYTDGVRRALGEHELGEIADTVSEALRHQVHELGAFMREGVPRMSGQSAREVNQVLRMQGGDILLRGATQAALGPLSPEKLLGLDEIFNEIKKIIRKLLQLIFPNLPKWFDEFILILDQLFRLLSSLLFPKVKLPLHKSEVQFLRELYELGRLEQLQERVDANGDDDDDV
ncbi:MAG TPA: hypothetical protein VFT45_13800 [Longimicrobium sp.]|nr:hypothetical protein [Longimicrobium sp.]